MKYDETYDDVQLLFLQTPAQSDPRQNPSSSQRTFTPSITGSSLFPEKPNTQLIQHRIHTQAHMEPGQEHWK